MASDLVLVANAADATVSTFALDAAGQRLEPLATSAVGRGCSTFVVDEERDLVYAATKGAADGHGQGVDSFRLDRTTGALTPLGHVDGTGYHYLALAHGGRVLAGAAYHSGEATTWVLDGEGGISDPVAEVAWRNAHAVATRAAHLYVVSLGEDLLAQYLLGDDGRLTPLDPPTVPAPPGSGPRHLVIDEAGTHVYVVTEFSGEVLTYTRDTATGTLAAAGATGAHATDRGLRHSRFGADPTAEHLIWGADIALARGGRLVLASERCESTLASLRIADDGVAGPMLDLADTEPQPRGFAVTTDGRYAVVAGERATTVELVAVGADGSLRSLARAHTGHGANWVRTIARRD